MASTEGQSVAKPLRVVVLGGTGAQGRPIVELLAASPNYQVSLLTRDVSNPTVRALADAYRNVHLIIGSYTTESGLRAALEGQDACYFNIDSFSTGELQEYFWTFRAYEIAVQCHLRHFIYPGAFDRFGTQLFNMDERYRNSHNIVASRITTWLTAQPTARLPWTIIEGGVYVEMLHTLLRPQLNPSDGSADFIAPMHPTSTLSLIPVANYAAAVKWVLENPERSVGSYVDAGSFRTTFPQIAEAFMRVTGKPARFVPIDIDTWMAGAKAAGIDPEARLPRGVSADDATSFTFRKSFGAWWALWRDGGAEMTFHDEEAKKKEMDKFTDEFLGKGRIRNIEDWMRRTEYDGKAKAVAKGNDTT